MLEQSARLADDDAERRVLRRETALQMTEHQRAAYARDAAGRARINAQRLGQPSLLDPNHRDLP